MGYLPDNMGFYPDMTGRQNLRMTGAMNGLSGDYLEARIDELIARVGMTEAVDRRAGTYSKGMKQRLGIADILIKDPDVLIMDEPTNGIDPEGMHELMALIRELADKDGKTILISSHQLHQIQQICDRVGIFVKGKLVACGEIGELGKQLEQESGFRLEVGAEPGGNALVEALKGVPGVSSVEENGETFLVQSATDVSDAVAQALLAQKFHLTYLRQCGSDLDEIYSRYFVKAGEQNEGSRSGRIFRHRRAKPRRESGGFSTLYQKELADHFHSARFKLVFALLILTSLASLYGALSSISDATFSSSEYLFLALYTASGSSIPSFASFLAYLAPLAGLAMGFDAINRERSQGTLNRLVSQPIHRDAVINAKFLAGVTTVGSS